jgi:hypothetical protein
MKKFPELQLDILTGDNIITKMPQLNHSGCLNANPFFNLGTFDWDKAISGNNNTSFITDDVLYNGGLFINGGRASIYSSNFFSVPYGFEYQIKVKLKSLYDGQPRDDVNVFIYAGIICSDAMLRDINLLHVAITKDKDTYYINDVTNLDDHKFFLVNDLNQGDTEITLRGNPDYLYQGNVTHNRSLRFYKQSEDFRYTDESGHLYDEWAYSRLIAYDPQGFYNKDITDNGDGTFTITLNQAYSKTPMLAGDGCLNTRIGGTHPYLLVSKKYKADGDIHTLSSPVRKAVLAKKKRYVDSLNTIRNGTMYGRVIVYANYLVRNDNNNNLDTSKVSTTISSIELIQTVP